MLTFRKGALGAPAAAKAMADYLKQSTLPDAAQQLMTYYTRGLEQLESDRGSVVEPRSDMHPAYAEVLRLDPRKTVSHEQLHHMLAGRAADGTDLPGSQRRASYADRDHVSYYDFTWSAPKSASIAMALAETEAERFTVVSLWREAVRDGMAQLETVIGHARKGAQGSKGRVAGHIGWASVDHFTARPTIEVPHVEESGLASTLVVSVAPPVAGTVPGDPQLHTHVAVPNVVVCDDGSVGSLDTAALHDAVKELGGYAQAEFATKMRTAGIAMEVDQRNGLSRLSAVDRDLETLFSKRSIDGEKLAREYVAAQGADYDDLHPLELVRVLQGATKAAREDKESNIPAWDAWRGQAAAAGLTYTSVMGSHGGVPALPRDERIREAYRTALPFLDAHFSRRSTMLASVARQVATTGLIAAGIEGPEDIAAVTKLMREHGVTHDGRMTPLIWVSAPSTDAELQNEGVGPQTRFKITTQVHVDQEQAAMRLIQAAAADRTGSLSPQAIERAVAAVSARDGLDFTNEHGLKQREVIDILGTEGRWASAIGVAGAGKTALLRPLIHAWLHPTDRAQAPREVYGVALARRQSELLEDAGIPRANVMPISVFLQRSQGLALGRDVVVVVDELSQVGTAHLLGLARLQAEHGFSVRTLGDQRQNQAIEAGSSIRLLQMALTADRIPELTSSVRQRGERDRQTALLFREGRAAEAIGRLQEDGHTRLVPGGRRHLVEAAAAFAQERIAANADNPKWSLSISAPTNEDARAIAAAMRPAKRAAGKLGPDLVSVPATSQQGTEAFDLPLAVGDRVRFYATTHAVMQTGKTSIFAANGGTADIVGIDVERGLSLRNRHGTVGFVSWDRMRHASTGRVQLSYGDAATIDSIQGQTSTEHINALPSGSVASHTFRNYPAQSRSTETTWMMVSQGLEQSEIMSRRALGSDRLVTDEAIWANVARNLGRQPDKELATELLARAEQVFRGAVRGFAAGAQPREAREARGETSTAAARTQAKRDEAAVEKAASNLNEAVEQRAITMRKVAGLLTGPRAAEAQDPRLARRAMRPAASRPQEARGIALSDGEIEAQAREAMHLAGLRPRGAIVMDGKMHRVAVEGDRKGRRSGSYVIHPDGRPAGHFHNFETGESVRWKADGVMPTMTAEERATERARVAAQSAAAAEHRLQAQRAAAAVARSRWSRSRPAFSHPYLTRKGIGAHGMRVDRSGRLLVPMRDAAGVVQNVQSIDAQGAKLYVKDGRQRGLHTMLGAVDPAGVIIVAEGIANAATMRELTGLPAAAAMNAGNLHEVAQLLRGQYPEARIILAADNDHHLLLPTSERAAMGNVGLEKATRAAAAVGAFVVTPPPLDALSAERGTDWNDHRTALGEDASRAVLRGLLIKQGITMADKQQVEAVLAQPRTTQAERDAARGAAAAGNAQAGTSQAQAAAQAANRAQQASQPKPPAAGL